MWRSYFGRKRPASQARSSAELHLCLVAARSPEPITNPKSWLLEAGPVKSSLLASNSDCEVYPPRFWQAMHSMVNKLLGRLTQGFEVARHLQMSTSEMHHILHSFSSDSSYCRTSGAASGSSKYLSFQCFQLGWYGRCACCRHSCQ